MLTIKNSYQENLSLHSLIDRYLIECSDSIENKLPYFHHICDQINSSLSLPIASIEIIQDRWNTIDRYKNQLKELLTRPKVQQRSEEWFSLRSNLITASDFAQALGAGKFGTQKQFYKKKCGYEEESFSHYIPPLKWGCMFEDVATKIYEKRQNTNIHDFGILPHPTIPFFGASPDGISEQGIMLEVKCPFMRKITGEIPEQYYYQIQGQLEVCDLNECDYLECQFKEYTGDSEFYQDIKYPYEQGIILEYSLKSEDNSVPHYQYSDILCYDYSVDRVPPKYIHPDNTSAREKRSRDLKKWTEDKVSYLESLSDVHNGDIIYHYWRLEVYNVVRVYRDKTFTTTKLQDLSHIWDKIRQYRGDKDRYLTEVCCKKMTKAQQAANAELFVRKNEKSENDDLMKAIGKTECEQSTRPKFAFEFLSDMDE